MHVTFRNFVKSVSAIALVCALSFAPAAQAQSATTGAIAGTVADAGGALVPGTVITVKSVELGVTRTVKANASGEYRVGDLQPGTYTVTFTADGFQTAVESSVTVAVGQIGTVSPKLLVGSVTDKVEVSGENTLIKTESNEISTTIDQNTIDNLPINGRRWSDFALLTPGVVSNSDGFGLLSFRGISYLLNNSTIDGADDNQAYFSEARGRTRSAYTVTQGAVQEFQVNTSNYSAEYGRAAGGVINTVTKSGTNQFHGEIFFYDRNNSLGGASNPYTQIYNFDESTGIHPQNVKPKDDRKQYGFAVGGPIWKDKIFWFYGFDQQKRNFPGIARTTDPYDLFALASPVLGAGETCTRQADTYGYYDFGAPTVGYSNSAAPSNSTLNPGIGFSVTSNLSNPPSYKTGTFPIGQAWEGNYSACALAGALYPSTTANAAMPYQQAAAYYNQGLGILASEFGPVPRFGNQTINFPKLDVQINDRNRLSMQYNRLRWDSPNGVQTQTSNFEGRGSYGNDFVKADVGVLRLSSVITNSIVNQFLVQYGRDMESEFPSTPLPNDALLANSLPAGECSAPHGGPCSAEAPDLSIGYGYDAGGFDAGNSALFTRFALPDERRLQLKDDVTYSHGLHTLKVGLDYNKVSDYINNLYNGYGTYDFDWAYSFIGDYLHKTTGLGGAAYAGGDAPHYESDLPGTTTGCPNPATTFTKYCDINVGLYSSFSQGFTVPGADGVINNAGASSLLTTREYAGYLTDNWRIKPRLTLTLGMRYEYEYVPANPTPNPDLNGNPLSGHGTANFYTTKYRPNTYNRPDDRNNIAPRIGFAYNIFGNNKTILRGGYGIYFGRIINANIEQSYQNSGGPNSQVNIVGIFPDASPGLNSTGTGTTISDCIVPFSSVTTYARAKACNADNLPNVYNNNVGAYSASSYPSVSYLDSNLRNPYVHEGDLDVQQDLGKGWVLTLTYMASFGRKLDQANDVNLNLSSATLQQYVVLNKTTSVGGFTIVTPPATPAVAQPHGGKPAPITASTVPVKVYSGSRIDADYYRILEITSNVNTNYNAGAIQINKQYKNGFSLLANYTYSHALDGNPYIGTGIPSFNVLDPNDLSKEYGNSSLDVRQRGVFALSYQPSTHFHGWRDQVLGGWRIAPVVQMQTGLPYTPYISGYPGQSLSGVRSANGAGGTSGRIDGIERNQYYRPNTYKADIRLGKNFYFNYNHYGLDKLRLEILGEVFNVMNHQNITGVQNTAYNLEASGTGASAVNYLILQPNFGTYTNSNSNYTYTPRQVQLAARIHF